MKNNKLFGRIVCLILAVVMCLSLAACGSSGQSGTANTKKDQEPTPEYVYTAEYKDLTQNRENYLNICAMTADGMYATSNEKIGENIPEGVTPEYEGQYDVYATFLYRIDNNGNLTKLDKYESMPTETDDESQSGAPSLLGVVPPLDISFPCSYEDNMESRGQSILQLHQAAIKRVLIRSG